MTTRRRLFSRSRRLAMLLSACLPAVAGASGKPMPKPYEETVPRPVDHAFSGAIELAVDATDTARKLFRVREVIPLQGSGPVTLLYPEWEISSHGRTISAANLAGLRIDADGRDVPWTRDPLDVHAFHVSPPAGATSLAVEFQYVTRVDDFLLRDDLVAVAWQHLLVYPAGWFARDIPVRASLTLPAGLTLTTPLRTVSRDAGLNRFAETSLDTLLDTPAYGARYLQHVELADPGRTPVRLDVMATDPADLAVTAQATAQLRKLVRETTAALGKAPYAGFDVLLVLSDDYAAGGYEHASSTEVHLPAAYLREPATQLNNLDLIAHEHVHAWNGRWRQPDELWTPTPNVPSRNGMLWVYEGQTEFWGRILAARSGMRSVGQTLDKLALDAAAVQIRAGRAWKSLEDTTNDPLYVSGRTTVWPEWQRRKDYYGEGVLLWLDVHAALVESSHGKRGIDEFAHAFFAVSGEPGDVSTYSFADICEALSRLAPMDWATFLKDRLTAKDARVLDGLRTLGWALSYDDRPTDTFTQAENDDGVTDLSHSIGLSVDKTGRVKTVVWDSPAFAVGMAPGGRVTGVDGHAFTVDELLDAVRRSPETPVRLDYDIDGKHRPIVLEYRGGARYPHRVRLKDRPDRLTPLLQPRT